MFLDVAHEDVDVIVYSKLVLEVVASVGNEEPVARFNQLVVVFVVVGNTVHSLLDDLQSYLGHVETLQNTLVLLVWLSIIGVYVKNHEFLSFRSLVLHLLLLVIVRFTAVEA